MGKETAPFGRLIPGLPLLMDMLRHDHRNELFATEAQWTETVTILITSNYDLSELHTNPGKRSRRCVEVDKKKMKK